MIQLSNIENIDRLEVKVRNRSSEISSERRKTARADSSRFSFIEFYDYKSSAYKNYKALLFFVHFSVPVKRK